MPTFTVEGPREVSAGVWFAERVAPSGWSFGMAIVRLRGGGLLVYSPTWLGEDTPARLESLGRPEVLVASNHFHHVSIGAYRKWWPDAIVVAAQASFRRLASKGHEGLRPIADVASRLVDGAHVLEPAGLKNGEVWLSCPADAGPTWITSDAFHQLARPVRGARGVGLRLARIRSDLTVSRLFPLAAVSDVDSYRVWLAAAVARERPACILLSHGAPVCGLDAGERLVAVVARDL